MKDWCFSGEKQICLLAGNAVWHCKHAFQIPVKPTERQRFHPAKSNLCFGIASFKQEKKKSVFSGGLTKNIAFILIRWQPTQERILEAQELRLSRRPSLSIAVALVWTSPFGKIRHRPVDMAAFVIQITEGKQPVLLIKRSRHLGLLSAGRRSRSEWVDNEKFVFVFVCSRTASVASPVHLGGARKKSDAVAHVSHYLNGMRCAGGKSAIQWEKCCWHDVQAHFKPFQCSNAAIYWLNEPFKEN